MTASITFYESFREYIADGTIDLDTHTFKVLLCTSTYTPSASGHSAIANITNELSGNGYARQTLGTVTWVRSGGTVTFDAANTEFTASGGSLVARYAVIYDDDPTSPADPLVAYILLDTTPADVTATDGNKIILAWNASGIFTLS